MSYITNTNIEAFHTAGETGAAAAVTISHASVIFRYGAANELLLWRGALANSRQIAIGDPMSLPAGALDINLPFGAIEDEAVQAAYAALYADKSSSATCLLGTGAMGATGKNNEAGDANYARQAIELTIALGVAP